MEEEKSNKTLFELLDEKFTNFQGFLRHQLTLHHGRFANPDQFEAWLDKLMNTESTTFISAWLEWVYPMHEEIYALTKPQSIAERVQLVRILLAPLDAVVDFDPLSVWILLDEKAQAKLAAYGAFFCWVSEQVKN